LLPLVLQLSLRVLLMLLLSAAVAANLLTLQCHGLALLSTPVGLPDTAPRDKLQAAVQPARLQPPPAAAASAAAAAAVAAVLAAAASSV
jgi:hypothetical protein